MNVYLAELPVGKYSWGDDYAMVIVAKDKIHAKRKARWSSDSFKQAEKINISQVNLNEEAAILTANAGS